MTDEQKKFANKIVAYFRANDGGPFTTMQIEDEILKEPASGSVSLKPVLSVLAHKNILLIEKAIIAATGKRTTPDYYTLSDKGWVFESYEKLIEDEDAERKLIKDQIQSVINTNNNQRVVLWLTVGLSVLTLATQIWDNITKQPIIVAPSKLEVPNLIIDKDSTHLRIYKEDTSQRKTF